MSEKENLLQQQGVRYRTHWSGVFLLICQVCAPLLIIGIARLLLFKQHDTLSSALAVYVFFLPLTVIGVFLNLFLGRILAVFQEKGFYGLREIEQSGGREIRNKEKLVFLPYDVIKKIQYRPTRSNRPVHKSDCSAVEVTFLNTDAEGIQYIDICVLRCGVATREARDFAKRIAKMIEKNSGKKIPVKHETGSYWLFLGMIAAFYICYLLILIFQW